MTKAEFEKLSKRPVTEDEYRSIELVYTFHPSISDTKGKEEIAYLFNTFGMRIILDMVDTANKAKRISTDILNTRLLLERYENDYRLLKGEI